MFLCRFLGTLVESCKLTDSNRRYRHEIQEYVGYPFCETCVVEGTDDEILESKLDDNGFVVPTKTVGDVR
jgi:hypothetical protein